MKFTAAVFALLALPSVSATWLRGVTNQNNVNNTNHDINAVTDWDGTLRHPFPPTTTVATAARRAQTVAPIFSIVIDNTSNDPLFNGLNIPANAAQVGMWSNQFPWPIVPIHAAVLSDGRLVTYGSPSGIGTQDGRLFVFWNPKQGTGSNSMQVVPNAQPVDSFCSTGALMPNGKFFVTGGNGVSGKGTTILDPFTSTPTRSFDLNFPRWYSTLTILPNGQHVITGGGSPYLNGIFVNNPSSSGTVSNTPEIFTEGQGWRALTGARSDDAFGFPNNHFWYPRQWVSPTGSVFGVSTEKIWEMQVGGNGSIRTISNFKTAPNTDTTLPNTGPTSAAVMYDTGKIIQVGGNGYTNGYGTQSSNQATIFDINGIGSGNVVVRDTQRMNFPRQWSTAIVLPNGRVLVTGGSRFADDNNGNAVLQAELWDPATERWTIGASAAVYRGYHSTVSLLPNGAVFSGGGGIPGPVTNFNAEIYYPPYLFTAQNGGSVLARRPTIVSLSANGGTYGTRVQVQLAPGDSCAEVSFSTLGSVTHAVDSNLRRMRLSFQVIANGVEITLPANANLAPPGYYYLSIVNGQGVPSKAVIFAMNSSRPPTPPTIPPVPPPTPQPVVPPTPSPVPPPTPSPVPPPTPSPVPPPTPSPVRPPTPSPVSPPTPSPVPPPTPSPVPPPTPSPVPPPTPAPVATNPYVAVRISYAADGTAATVDTNGNLYISYSGHPFVWLRNNVKDVALVDRNRMYIIGRTDSNVYRWDGANWKHVGIYSSYISANPDGTVAVVNSVVGSIWVKTGYDDNANWQMVPWVFGATRVAMVNGSSIYYLTSNGNVYRSDRFNLPVQVGQGCLELTASNDGAVICANTLFDLWRKTANDNTNAWYQLPGKAKNVAVLNKYSTRITIDLSGNTVRWS